MMKKQKVEAIAAKRRRNRGGISLSSKEEKNNNSNTIKDTDLDQVEDKYPVLSYNRGEVIINKGIKLKVILCPNFTVFWPQLFTSIVNKYLNSAIILLVH